VSVTARSKGRGVKARVQAVSPLVRDVLALAAGEKDMALCEAAGVDPFSLSHWRRGVRTPNVTTIEKVAAAMGYRIALVRIDD